MATKARRTRSPSSKTSPPADFVSIAIAYAEEAIEDRKRKTYGKWTRLAAKRFIGDLKRARAKRPAFVFSPERANHVCEWIELLPHVEGTWNRQTIKLEPAQVFFLVNLFGFRRSDGTRRFTTALFAIARKNAKSTLAAAILLYCLCEEPENGPQVISAATTGDQARIVWSIAKRMVERTPDLQEEYQVEAFANAIARYANGGTCKPINSKASTQDGLNPSALSFDELHAHKSHELFNVLRSAAGSRKNPLFLYTTTEGYENPGPWAEERRFAEQLLAGLVEADHYLAVIYALDDDDEDFDESKWIKANPLIGVSVSLAKLQEAATEAKQKPGSLAEFRIKRLNRRATSASGWIVLPTWLKCAGEVPLEMLQQHPCWCGLDLASTTDMNAWRLVWRVDGIYYTWGRYWVPESAVAQRNERGNLRYDPWVQAGWITKTDGDVTDYAVIKRDILEDCARFHPSEIAFDPWNASYLVSELGNDHGLTMVQSIQGAKTYNPSMQELERAYTSKTLAHGGNPVLNWNAANIVARRDANMNMAPDKRKSGDKIDGVVALLMAMGRAMCADKSNSVYESRGVIVL